MAATSEAYAGMGTTVVAACSWRTIGCRWATSATAGCTRSGGRLRQLTDDDSWVATVLAQNPETDPALLQHHPMRNALTNVVGARPRVDVHVVEETLSGGERFLLTTDGVHGVLDERQLERLIVEGGRIAAAMPAALVSAALARGSRDNCTAIVANAPVKQRRPRNSSVLFAISGSVWL